MADTNGNGKSVTWKYLAGTLVTLLLLIAGGVFAGMQSDIKVLQKEKVDKEQYYLDINEIKGDLKDIKLYMRGK